MAIAEHGSRYGWEYGGTVSQEQSQQSTFALSTSLIQVIVIPSASFLSPFFLLLTVASETHYFIIRKRGKGVKGLERRGGEGGREGAEAGGGAGGGLGRLGEGKETTTTTKE